MKKGLNKKNKKLSGVTLLELIVVIAIIGILAAVAIISMGSASSASKMEAVQKELASEIKLAQSYALQGKTHDGITPCGYGATFNADGTYNIFYNNLDSSKVDCDTQNLDSSFNAHRPSSESMDGKTLSYGIRPNASGEIYFTVPSAKIYYGGGSELTSNNNLSIILTGVNLSKYIKIYTSGFIELEQ
jgi:prepilin-type N-terminal cleavage/methylation domain-containing protein